ncbi:hypothetical protein BESB_073170 [Besnoitia besnoiti]|uniref:GYF domain-containing protein n=1 Tax=Besnoitia besnoiti TaxID=94643 RepID=A0A2A9M847_BESBE|nr:uncharacterized protein BESB_073170 [Besnoitia besnoiti]PFH34165.1 hypothetical protein BESB_073170 [Besnoitia besnoiti]
MEALLEPVTLSSNLGEARPRRATAAAISQDSDADAAPDADVAARDASPKKPTLWSKAGRQTRLNLLAYEPKKWQYTDEKGVTQGPASALKILKWLEAGLFNGRGDEIFFSAVGSKDKPACLADALPAILEDAYFSMEKQIAPRTFAEEKPEEPEIVEEPPMQFAEDVFSTEAALDIQKLHKSFGSCDLMVWLVPHQKHRLDDDDGGGREFRQPPKIYKIPVHSALLRISSPIWLSELTVIEERMRTRMKYQQLDESQVMMKYVIETSYPAAIRAVIQYIYGYRQELLQGDPFLMVSVYKEADKLEMRRLQAEVLRALSVPMSIGPLVALARAAEVLKVYPLLSEIIRILADSAYALFSGMRHLQLGPRGLQLLLNQDNIQLDELQIYICASAWLSQQDIPQTSWFYTVDSPRPMSSRPLSPTSVALSDSGHSRGAGRSTSKSKKDKKDNGLFADGTEDTRHDKKEDPKNRREEVVMAVYQSIRFDAMSPTQINACRDPRLDSLLLDACLRKFVHAEKKARVFPWTANDQFAVECDGSMFPVLVTRKSQLTASNKRTNQGSATWAWTVGDPRLVNEAMWAVEVVHTAKGRLHLGIAIEDRVSHTRIVCYLDPVEKIFVTGTITSDPSAVSYRTAQAGGCVKWSRRLARGDIVIVRVSVAISVLHLTIQVLRCKNMTASFMLPLRSPVRFPGQFLQRPFVTVWPFLEAFDFGDTLGVAEIQPNSIDIQ